MTTPSPETGALVGDRLELPALRDLGEELGVGTVGVFLEELDHVGDGLPDRYGGRTRDDGDPTAGEDGRGDQHWRE